MRRITGYLLALAALSFGACNTQDLVNQAGAQCQSVLDTELPKVEATIWDKCTSYYEDTVMPTLVTALKSEEDTLIMQMRAEIQNGVNAELIGMGCVKWATQPGWNCTALCLP